MTGKQFLDTNILIYAHDLDAGHRHEVAVARVKELWKSGLGVISVQVLQEFYVNVTRKISKPLSMTVARGLVESYAVWQVETPTVQDVSRASELQERWQLSFWDAMIVVAAMNGGAETIVSEDLNAGQLLDGICIENPFL